MRVRRIAESAAVGGALALPIVSAPAASAATTIARCSAPTLPYAVHAKAVAIRAKATATSAAVGVLYRVHRFTVQRRSGNWRHIADKTAGITGWVFGTYVYRDVAMCLD
ncbi:SH3 domain-containing protein [Streptomyces venezuelae]|uniref:SH3 domain-containing protein n=1 Tax=Streptomyces venezuelae TaxID=54571 RepID=A0A5P2BAD0_STRVZ|nr:SH3 domain-containing protein [Streptomyces venezuelae]QES27266.1 SH3 domain-containing protein [Streptomyces venezuelae]